MDHQSDAPDWEQQPREPDLWYGRFHQFYLLAGSERSLDGAYRRFKQGAQNGGNSVSPPPLSGCRARGRTQLENGDG